MEDRYGINMRQFCQEHERQVSIGPASLELLELHQEKVGYLQHERLVHLIVLVMVVFVELFLVDLTLLHPETNPGSAVLMLLCAVLLGFYFRHYFFLENTVQHWYRLTERLREELAESDQ